MTRDDVLDLMYYAKTLADCKRAWEARDAWLNEHPDDEDMIEESESLYMREQAIPYMEEQKLRERVASAVST